jgi:hypothetical protein
MKHQAALAAGTPKKEEPPAEMPARYLFSRVGRSRFIPLRGCSGRPGEVGSMA